MPLRTKKTEGKLYRVANLSRLEALGDAVCARPDAVGFGYQVTADCIQCIGSRPLGAFAETARICFCVSIDCSTMGCAPTDHDAH